MSNIIKVSRRDLLALAVREAYKKTKKEADTLASAANKLDRDARDLYNEAANRQKEKAVAANKLLCELREVLIRHGHDPGAISVASMKPNQYDLQRENCNRNISLRFEMALRIDTQFKWPLLSKKWHNLMNDAESLRTESTDLYRAAGKLDKPEKVLSSMIFQDLNDDPKAAEALDTLSERIKGVVVDVEPEY